MSSVANVERAHDVTTHQPPIFRGRLARTARQRFGAPWSCIVRHCWRATSVTRVFNAPGHSVRILPFSVPGSRTKKLECVSPLIRSARNSCFRQSCPDRFPDQSNRGVSVTFAGVSADRGDPARCFHSPPISGILAERCNAHRGVPWGSNLGGQQLRPSTSSEPMIRSPSELPPGSRRKPRSSEDRL